MIINNTSKYPIEEVRELVKFAANVFDSKIREGLIVNVKNSKSAYRGRAYNGIPSISPWRGKGKRLVVIAIGKNSQFPKDCLVTKVKWIKVGPNEKYDVSQVRSVVKGSENWIEKRIETKQPYGGKNAPNYIVNNWREALVSIAAHELAHINQYVNNLSRGELYTETMANFALNEYRKTLDNSKHLT